MKVHLCCLVSAVLFGTMGAGKGALGADSVKKVPPARGVTIITYSGRALRDAVRILERQLGCPITFEDSQYKNPHTFIVLYGNLVLPVSEKLSFTYDPQGKSNRITIIQALLDKYRRDGGRAVYRVSRAVPSLNATDSVQEIFDVVPIEVQDETGALIPCSSLLDTRVSLSVSGSIDNLTTQVANAVSKSADEPNVIFADFRERLLSSAQASLTVKDQTARVCLDQLLVEASQQLQADPYNIGHKESKTGKLLLSWLLNADPDWAVHHEPSLDSSWLGYEYFPPVPQPIAGTVSVQAEDYRPLAQVAGGSAQHLGQTFMYEDVPWACDCEVLKNPARVPIVPRGGIFSFSFVSTSAPSKVISDCVTAYDQTGNPGKFAAKSVGLASYIYPTQSMNTNGTTNIIRKPLLDTVVTISAKTSSPTKLLRSLCLSLSHQTGQTVTLKALPTEIANAPVASSSVNETKGSAAAFLASLSQRFHRNLSWYLLFDPRTKQYQLSEGPLQE